MEVLKFVIVGHVDHGKSTLIGRLLYDTNSLPQDKIEEIKKVSKELGKDMEFAFLLDHLEEERGQGITIDTTQVFFKSDKRRYVIIDAPGHVEFLKNMVTGASQADAGVLIIDVKEGVREQTKRHAYVLSFLGIKQILVLLNKMDLVAYSQDRFSQVKKEIEDFLKSLGMDVLYYIPISAKNGDNVTRGAPSMPWYKGPTFLESLDLLKIDLSHRYKGLIFPIQDIYEIDGKKIIVGRIASGCIRKGMKVRILPHDQVLKVNSIEKYMKNTSEAFAGESIGITLEEPIPVSRGDVILNLEEESPLCGKFSAIIFWLAKDGLQKGSTLTIRCATQEAECEIEEIKKRIDSATLKLIEEDSQKLGHLEVAEVVIKAKRPLILKPFDEVREVGRFVLLQEGNISAGGIITKV
jgi:sulfate adenylyltransferase large subunit